jgi:hypothetical protein
MTSGECDNRLFVTILKMANYGEILGLSGATLRMITTETIAKPDAKRSFSKWINQEEIVSFDLALMAVVYVLLTSDLTYLLLG